MAKSKEAEEQDSIRIDIKGKVCEPKIHGKGTYGGGVYCVGAIGAVIYFISNATGFWNGVLGVLKAMVWPAFVVHGLLGLFGL